MTNKLCKEGLLLMQQMGSVAKWSGKHFLGLSVLREVADKLEIQEPQMCLHLPACTSDEQTHPWQDILKHAAGVVLRTYQCLGSEAAQRHVANGYSMLWHEKAAGLLTTSAV